MAGLLETKKTLHIDIFNFDFGIDKRNVCHIGIYFNASPVEIKALEALRFHYETVKLVSRNEYLTCLVYTPPIVAEGGYHMEIRLVDRIRDKNGAAVDSDDAA